MGTLNPNQKKTLEIYLPEVGCIQVTKIEPNRIEIQSTDPKNHPLSLEELETAYRQCLSTGLLAPLKTRKQNSTPEERVNQLFSPTRT